MHRFLRGALIGVLLVLSPACGSDSPSGPEDPGEPTSNLDCTSPALGASSAPPFARVAVTGVTGISEETTWAEFETASGTTGITPIHAAGGGVFEVVVPAHPDDLMSGGPITLVVTDGINRCEGLTIEVQALAPVEGDPLVETAEAFDLVIDAFVADFGLDEGTLASTPLDALPPHAVPVALLIEARDAFDPATILAGLSADEAAFVQALVAQQGLAATYADLAGSLGGDSAAPAQAGGGAPVQVAQRRECTYLGAVPPGVFDLSTAQKLVDRIANARAASAAGGPLAQAIGDYGTAFAVMGLAVPQVGAVAGWLAFGAQLVQKMVAGLYPSSLTKLEYRLEHARIEEDWDTSDGDPEIKWGFAKLWAENTGMGLARVGIDLITTAAALPPAFKGAVGNTGIGALDIAGKEALNKRLDELEKDPDADAECWGVGPTEFGPVVVDDNTGDKFVRAEVTGGDAISVDATDIRKLKPEKIGTATLRVRTQEIFEGPFAFEDKPVEVLRKEIVWIPRRLVVRNPGEDVTVKFRVDNARHDDGEKVEVTPGPYLPDLNPSYAGGVHTITFNTPGEKEGYPTWIDARSTSKELPPNLPVREGRIEIVAEEWVEIDQKNPCVGSGKTEQFTAIAGGPDDPVVMWEVYSGAGTLLNETGLTVTYQAPPSGSGQVTLRAYLSTNDEAEDFVTFSYGLCGGLAAWWGHAADIGFPFLPGEPCNNPDLDAGEEDVNYTENAFEPSVRPGPADLFINRTQTFNQSFSDTGTFGDRPPGAQTCLFDAFSAEASYDGALVGSADGTRLDIDMNVFASSEAKSMGELGTQWSSASAAMTIGARWDFDITQATDYRLQVELDCVIPISDFGIPFSGVLSLIPVQVRPDGSFAPVNFTTQPIQIQAVTGVPIRIDQVMEFDAPLQGQSDHIVVIMQMGVTAFGAGGTTSGEVTTDGVVTGFISIEPQ